MCKIIASILMWEIPCIWFDEEGQKILPLSLVQMSAYLGNE